MNASSDTLKTRSKATRPKASKPARHARPTLAVIARQSGFAVSTVSAILNNHANCWASTDTRKRVTQVARELGYRPNLVARSLQGGRTWTLGVVTAALNIEITSEKIQIFEALARDAGYTTMIAFAPNGQPEIENRVITRMLDRNIDGLVIYPTEHGPHELLQTVMQRDIPIVTIDGHGRIDLPCDDVSMDYETAGRMQAQYLIETGHRRLVQVNTLPSCYTKDALQRGFVNAVVEAGLPRPLVWEIEIPHDAGNKMLDSTWMALADRIKAHRGQFDGVASYDLVAAGVMRAAYELNIRVPDEFSVIGMDNVTSATNGQIPLTTLAQPVKALGEAIHRLIQLRIDQKYAAGDSEKPRAKASPIEKLLLPPELIVRRSTQPRSNP